ncbi:unnamed protein product [Psylliodes chrysocephalus]|uniref:Uncharacterized protein n=1 Tax=Psylliodes chrysocephalus TaxID=3402493 RepID=A0A9P0GKF2_9CUCU|nr:unnamed protein product [Psylliodes chrysocephala]
MISANVHLLFYIIFLISAHVKSGFTTTKMGPQPLWNATYTDKLRHDLLLNYDKFARPAQHFNKTTVQLGLEIRHVEFNEFKSMLTAFAWLRLVWNDEKLKWNTSDYGDINTLHIAEHEIWQPDIYLYNSAVSSPLNQYVNTHILVYPNGEVLWVPPVQLTVLCTVHLRYWPFDTQECNLVFGSWTYSGEQIDLAHYNNRTMVNLEMVVTNAEWDIAKAEQVRNVKKYDCCEEPYPDITIKLVLNRIPNAYKTIIITPAFVIITLTLLSFWLPPQASEKIIINGCTAIIICLFMLYFSQKLPLMGKEIPLVVLFYTSCLYIVCLSMIGSVVVITMSRTKHCSTLPWIIKQPLTGKFGKLLGLESYIYQSGNSSHRVTAEEMRDHQVTDFEDGNSSEDNHIIKSQLSATKPSLQRDWILLAAAIDRLSFCFYCFLFVILSIAYSL